MAPTPSSVTVKEFVDIWLAAMPELRDTGEADLMNRFLGRIYAEMQRRGKVVPDMVFVTDQPPSPDREKLLASGDTIRAEHFAAAVSRWDQTPQFKRFWQSLTEEERKTFWKPVHIINRG